MLGRPIPVNSTTRVVADDLQWIVQTRQKAGWTSRAFIGGNSSTLLRVLREMNRVPTTRGQAALDKLPVFFVDWANKHRKKKRKKS